METLLEVIKHPLAAGSIQGLVSAASIDYMAFRNFKTLDEFASYSWLVATFRWAQGAVVGAITAAGLGAF